MLKTLSLATGLALVAGAALAQSAPEPAGKVKIKTKRGREATPATAAPTGQGTDYSTQYAALITPDGLRQDLSVLASDEYEGRETGQKGQKMAADYIAKAFAADGLAGPVAGSDNPYLQHFTMYRSRLAPSATVQVGGKTYVPDKDFYALADGTFAQPTPATVRFVGYGIKAASYDDYASAGSVQGQDVALLLGEPRNAQGQPVLGPGTPYGQYTVRGLLSRLVPTRATPPRLVMAIAPTAEEFAKAKEGMGQLLNQEKLSFTPEKAGRQGLNILLVGPELGAALLGTTPAGLLAYEKITGAAGKPTATKFKPAAATVALPQQTQPFQTENVLGYLEGGDKKDEVVVLSAHYDHLGIKNGVVYNGADDDGSGTSSVLAMARAFTQAKAAGHGPRRSLLFLANVGEEEGLLGSQYYTDHPVFPLANTVTDLNIDMVGRVDSVHQGKGDYVYVVGDDKLSSELHTLSEATNQQYNPVALDYKYNDPNDPERIYYRSDHYNFAKHNIPIIFYTSGLHKDYHQATDDVDKIDFPAMARRDQLVFHTAWAVANRDQRLTVDAAKATSTYTPTPAELTRYDGTYGTTGFPLKIIVSHEGNTLKAQATGQPAFDLEPVAAGKFKFDMAGLTLTFPADKPAAMLLEQGGHTVELSKQ